MVVLPYTIAMLKHDAVDAGLYPIHWP